MKIDSTATALPVVSANRRKVRGIGQRVCMSNGSFEPVDVQILSMLVQRKRTKEDY